MDSFTLPLSFLLLSLFVIAAVADDNIDHLSFSAAVANNEPDPDLEPAKETKTQFRFYFHDIVTGSNPTAIRVAQAPSTSTSPTAFGAVVMMDDPLTETADPNSKLIGRAQGMYALASQHEAGLLMALNIAFVEGEFNGSCLAVLGRNTPFSEVREMPVIGGSGRFRFARGYVMAKTHQFDLITGNAVVEWNVHVMHH